MKTKWALPLMLVGSAAHATGLTPGDLETAAQSADTARQQLMEASEQLRLAIAYNPSAAIGSREEGEQVALSLALSTWDADGDLRARWFMAGAIPQPPGDGRTAYYNPLARGWLLIDWVRSEQGWRVADASLISSGPASWPSVEQPWRKAFAEDYARALRAAATDAGDIAGGEADKWIVGLAVWQHDPARRNATASARKLILDGRTAKFGGGNIDLLPDRARSTYWPVAAITRKDGGGAVLFGSAILPHLLIAADFSSAAMALEKLSLINLANAGEPK